VDPHSWILTGGLVHVDSNGDLSKTATTLIRISVSRERVSLLRFRAGEIGSVGYLIN